MCVSQGAPKKPSYGACNERHGGQVQYLHHPTILYSTDYWACDTSTGSGTWTTTDWCSTAAADAVFINII